MRYPKTGPDLTSFTANDLAIAVLPAERLEGTAQGLEIDPDQSGFSDNERAADDTIDPEDEPADPDEAGRENGYTLAYVDGDFSSLKAKRGVFGRARVGDASVFVFATFDTPPGGFDSLFVYVRIGRTLGTLYATATKGKLKVADAAAIAEKMTNRMASPIEA